jgi:hypothetical protein
MRNEKYGKYGKYEKNRSAQGIIPEKYDQEEKMVKDAKKKRKRKRKRKRKEKKWQMMGRNEEE